ncbi:universal stress protein [Noviherbaspirillum galbum]|uniref:Universal stress protein n=1 Tax=Noviherbaspirillum galbum TaxID=2709383 RepID=A0A6B3SX98_9BURK|nr:universal stress protein [Noviherbaspirillum galbum]NEX62369.1 universal stress protein [Noviherbaspirillum galbum]
MFHSILVPTDGSELARKAVSVAVKLAKQDNASLLALSVAEPYPYGWVAEAAAFPEPESYEKQMRTEAETALRQIELAAREAGVRCELRPAFNTSPANEIVRTAEDHGCDLIVMASHGRRGLDRLLLGSVTQRVLLQTEIPVLVVR